MKIHTRKCANSECSNVLENTRTNSDICFACSTANKTSAKAALERGILEGLGYVDIKDPVINKFSQRTWTFVHSGCGIEQTWTFGNIQTRLKKDPKNIPCSFCGAKRRTENMNS